MCTCKYPFICVSLTTWQVLIVCDFCGFKREKERVVVGEKEGVF